MSALYLAQTGDDAIRERKFKSLGCADGIDFCTDFERFGATNYDCRSVKTRDTERAYIQIPIGVLQGGRVFLVPAVYLEAASVFDDVTIGDYIPFGKYDTTTP